MTLKDLEPYLKNEIIAYIATNGKNGPAVRAMTLIHHNDRFWICTTSDRTKVKEIKTNNSIEFCYIIKTRNDAGSLRGRGTAEIIRDPETKKELSGVISFFSAYWTSFEDPDFILYRLDIEAFDLHHPEDKKHYSIPRKIL